MLTLKNLIKKDSIIEADYFFEQEFQKIGHFKYDIKMGKFIERKKTCDDEIGFAHVIYAIKMFIKYDKYPNTYTTIWY